MEAELQQLEAAEASEYLESLGVSEGGLRSLVQATYDQLGLATYFTTGVWLLSAPCKCGLLAIACVVWAHATQAKQPEAVTLGGSKPA